MKTKAAFLCGFLVLILTLAFIACPEPDEPPTLTPVTFSGVFANGDPATTTTQLTLVFSAAVNGFAAEDITLSGVAGITKGTLSGSNPYILPIDGFTAGGTLSVAVAKAGYDISGSLQTAAIYYYSDTGPVDIPVTFSGVSANGNVAQTTTELTLTFSAGITGLNASDITLSGVAGVNKGTLSGTGPTYTLPISGFTAGGTLSVTVAKANYDISGSPKTATIYYWKDTNPNPVVEGATFLRVSSRVNNWDTIDIRANLTGQGNLSGYTSGKNHTFKVQGKTVPNTTNIYLTPASGAGAGNNSYNDITEEGGRTESDVDGMFTTETVITWAKLQNDNNVRIMVGVIPSSWYELYEITITDADGKVVYKMSTDAQIQALADGDDPLPTDTNLLTWLRKPGSPTIRAVVPSVQ